MYWTYAILDPLTGLFVYVGQTNDFERRKRQHRAVHHKKGPFPAGSIKTWLSEAHRRGVEPVFIVLEVVETDGESKESETKWVEKLGGEAGHPLRNRWDEHIEAMQPKSQWPGRTTTRRAKSVSRAGEVIGSIFTRR